MKAVKFTRVRSLNAVGMADLTKPAGDPPDGKKELGSSCG